MHKELSHRVAVGLAPIDLIGNLKADCTCGLDTL